MIPESLEQHLAIKRIPKNYDKIQSFLADLDICKPLERKAYLQRINKLLKEIIEDKLILGVNSEADMKRLKYYQTHL